MRLATTVPPLRRGPSTVFRYAREMEPPKVLRRSSALGCSAFCLETPSGTWVARNLDVPFVDGHILVNPRGLAKQSIVVTDAAPARWASSWGSLTVNLLGVDCPMGGMNERGLVIEHLWMPGTQYPKRYGRDVLLEFEWIQSMLDTCVTVEDVLTRAERVAIAPGRVGMHFLAADGAGDRALLEYRDGRPLVYAGPAFQPAVVANSWYDESVRSLEAPTNQPVASMDALGRFARLARATRGLIDEGVVDGRDVLEVAMDLLDSVVDSTLVSAVYQPAAGSMTFRTSRNPDLRELRVAEIDFSPDSGRTMLGLHAAVDAWRPFATDEIVAVMQDVFSVGGDFLRLDAYRQAMMRRQG